MCKSHPGGTGVEGIKSIWGYRRSQLQLMAKNWRNHAKELRLATMKRAYEKLFMRTSCSGRQQSFGDTSTMKWPPSTAAAVEYRHLEPRKKSVCYKEQSWSSVSSPLEEPRRSWMDLRHWTVRVWFWFWLLLCPDIFPSWRKCLSGAHS